MIYLPFRPSRGGCHVKSCNGLKGRLIEMFMVKGQGKLQQTLEPKTSQHQQPGRLANKDHQPARSDSFVNLALTRG